MRKPKYILESTAAAESLQTIGLVKGSAWDREDTERRRLLQDYSSLSTFLDDTWIIDKKELQMNFPDTVRRFHFAGIDPAIKDTIKDWVLQQLLAGRKIKGIKSSLSDIRNCLTVVHGKDADELDDRDIMAIYDSLFTGKNKASTSVSKWNNLKGFFTAVDCAEQAGRMGGYDVPVIKRRKKAEKYIPEEVAVQMDILFMSEEVPLTYRCIYWTLRLIPNRIEEVCSIRRTALKQIAEDRYLLIIPVSKTAGPFEEPDKKCIQIIYSGMGQFYVDLLKKQVDFTNEMAPESDFLFVSRKICYMKDKATGGYGYRETGEKLFTVHEKICMNFFGTLGKRHGFKDKNGKIVSIGTQQFRHTGISDRLESKTFRQIDVMHLTGHKNTAMINGSYSHPMEPEKKTGFRGMIGDERRVAMILRRPYTKELHHLGVCMDIRECSNDRLACLSCEHLVIDEEALPFMIRDYKDWIQKRSKADQRGNDSFVRYCRDWIDAYRKLFIKIGLNKEDYDGI